MKPVTRWRSTRRDAAPAIRFAARFSVAIVLSPWWY
jgi:hypothetical protein